MDRDGIVSTILYLTGRGVSKTHIAIMHAQMLGVLGFNNGGVAGSQLANLFMKSGGLFIQGVG